MQVIPPVGRSFRFSYHTGRLTLARALCRSIQATWNKTVYSQTIPCYRFRREVPRLGSFDCRAGEWNVSLATVLGLMVMMFLPYRIWCKGSICPFD